MSHFSELDSKTLQAIEEMRDAEDKIQSTAFADGEWFDPERFMREGDA
jgi:hypothetical protein